MSSKRLIFPAKPFYFSVEIRPAVARRSDTAVTTSALSDRDL